MKTITIEKPVRGTPAASTARPAEAEQPHARYEQLMARCKGLPPTPTAVAYPCDQSSLEGALEGGRELVQRFPHAGGREDLDLGGEDRCRGEQSNDCDGECLELHAPSLVENHACSASATTFFSSSILSNTLIPMWCPSLR